MPLYSINDFQSLEQAYWIKNSSDIEKLFPKTGDEIEIRFQAVKNYTTVQLQNIIAIPVNDRTFENTVLAFDKVAEFFQIYSGIISAVKMVHPDDAIRKKAEETLVKCTEVGIDLFQSNREVYRMLKEYQSMSKEELNEERTYYFSELMEGLKIAGFELEDKKFEKLQELRKQIATLSIQFQSNISQDKSKICLTKDELAGLNEDFMNSLASNDGRYTLYCDYPTSSHVMSNCNIEQTRQKYHQAFKDRAYPQNIHILNQLINTRDDLANLLGYKSYAEYDIVMTMAGSIGCVEKFLNGLFSESIERIRESWKILIADLPDSAQLNLEGKIKPWDAAYISDQYLKKHFSIDEEKISEYFPMEATIRGLLDIYEKFFNLKFKIIDGYTFWHSSVQMIEVMNVETNNMLGYILVDLFPRENKFSHACCVNIIPPMSFDKGQSYAPALAIVIANFSKPTEKKPSLLRHHEVRTFFHEFGHAIHALVGRAEMPSKSGSATKFDFIETPSKLLEEWIWDAEILKNLSCHYQTGKPLGDDILQRLIDKRIIQEKISLGGNLFYAKYFLELYKEGKNKDFVQIKKDLYDNYSSRMVVYDPEVNFLCAIVHLTGYGPKYYTYLWSEQLAKKIFDYIKSNGGLLDPAMGKRYISKIIGCGGSCDPQKMVDDFLKSDIE